MVRIRFRDKFRVRSDVGIRARVEVRVRVRVRIRARVTGTVRAGSRLMVSLLAPLDTPAGRLYVLSEPRDVQPPITSLVASGLGWGQCRQG